MLKTFYEIENPLVKHKLSKLRDTRTTQFWFRRFMSDITYLMVPAVTERLKTVAQPVDTPVMEKSLQPILITPIPVVIPILRAGLGMLGPFEELVPCETGLIGLRRNEKTHLPSEFYKVDLPKLEHRPIFVLDPMLATGGSASATVQFLIEHGAEEKQIVFVCIVAAPEGVSKLQSNFPYMEVYAANLDDGLTGDAFIYPGLGDAGDRLYGINTTPLWSIDDNRNQKDMAQAGSR